VGPRLSKLVPISEEQKKVLLMLIEQKYFQCLSKFVLMDVYGLLIAFPSNKEGPKVAKISRRAAACGPWAALLHNIEYIRAG